MLSKIFTIFYCRFDSSSNKNRLHLNNSFCPNLKTEIDIYARNLSNINKVFWDRIFRWSSSGTLIVFPEATEILRIITPPDHLSSVNVVTIEDPPFTMVKRHLLTGQEDSPCERGVPCKQPVIKTNVSVRWEVVCCIGMAIDLLLLIELHLNIKSDVYIVQDGFYGAKTADGQWNGLINDIYDGSADLGIAALTPTFDRQEMIDFTEPWIRSDLVVGVNFLPDSRNFINWEWLEPLEVELRYWILVTFMVGTILVYCLENKKLVLQRIIDPSIYARYSWREGFSYFSGLTFQRDLGGKNPQRLGARVTAIAFAFGMVIIMTTYTAVLTASKVQQEKSNPFFGFDDERVST